MQKIDFESQNFAIFNNFYASLHKAKKKFIGQQFGLYPKGMPCQMCESVQQKLGHTNIFTQFNFHIGVITFLRKVSYIFAPTFSLLPLARVFRTNLLKLQVRTKCEFSLKNNFTPLFQRHSFAYRNQAVKCIFQGFNPRGLTINISCRSK